MKSYTWQSVWLFILLQRFALLSKRLFADFRYNRNDDNISGVRNQVEKYEQLVKEQAEKIEQARFNAVEAERLQKEVEELKK